MNLEINVKITENKAIRLGKNVFLFGKQKIVIGFWNSNSLVIATKNPKTMAETQVLIYTIDELKEFYEEGNLQGLVDING